jgi:histidine ammonia-lyase
MLDELLGSSGMVVTSLV